MLGGPGCRWAGFVICQWLQKGDRCRSGLEREPLSPDPENKEGWQREKTNHHLSLKHTGPLDGQNSEDGSLGLGFSINPSLQPPPGDPVFPPSHESIARVLAQDSERVQGLRRSGKREHRSPNLSPPHFRTGEGRGLCELMIAPWCPTRLKNK